MIRRNFFYSLVIVSALLVAELELRSGHFTGFWIANIVVFTTLILELFTASLHSHAHLRSHDSLLNFDDYSRAGQMINHLLVPITLYASAAGFLYFFGNTWAGSLTLISLLFLFTLLFTHLTAYFASLQTLIKQTHQAYDVAKLAIVFFATGFFWQIGITRGQMEMTIFTIFILILGALLLSVIRYQQWNIKAIGITFIIVVCFLIVLIGLAGLSLAALEASLILSLLYYAVVAGLQHYFDHDLTLAIVLEYALVISLIVIIILGLNT